MSGELIDASLLELFRVELENHSRILEQGLVTVESEQTPEKVEPLMRAAHSIKGAARIVGLDAAVQLAHAMEDLLTACQHGKLRLVAGHIDLLLQGNDVFKHLAAVPVDAFAAALAERATAIGQLTGQLQQSMTAPPATPAPAPPATPAPAPAAAPAIPSAPPAAAPVEAAPPARTGGKTVRDEERSVRVLAESLSRIIGLCGESLVQTASLSDFNRDLRELAKRQREFTALLEQIGGRGESASLEEIKRIGQELTQLRDLLGGVLGRFADFTVRHENTVERLYDEVVACRMRPFADGGKGFPRLVRDTARSLEKQADYVLLGAETRVDRDILEKLEAPLTHLLRNALDHGLESPAERVAAGKSEKGRITLEARHAAGRLQITVSDDGRGIDFTRLRRKVVEKGHVTTDMAEKLSEAELTDFLFLPGFSTAAAVSEISGRGVGLDVVQNMVHSVGGALSVTSRAGQGTTFALTLPLTLSVVRALLVEIGGEPYALSLSRIDRILNVAPADLATIEDRQFCTVDKERIGLVDAHQLFALPSPAAPPPVVPVIVVSDTLNRFGVAVDRIRGERELVVIPLDARLGKIPDVAAGAILEDGSPVIILDPDDLVRSIDALLNQGRLQKVGRARQREASRAKRVLVVDDSLTVREVERKLLTGRGYEVVTAVDGMDGWNLLQTGRFDLLISDVDMPRLNGIDLVKRLRQSPHGKELPVLIVSYKEREEDRRRGLEAGANYYLTKSSFHDETLVNAVKDLIGEA